MADSEVLMRSWSGAASKLPSWPHRHEIEDEDEDVSAARKEEVARETSKLIESKKRLSVRDLATKFERRHVPDALPSPKAAAAAAPESPKVQDKNSLDEGGQFDKLKRILSDLTERVGAGRVKDDVEQALDVAGALSAMFVERQNKLASKEREERLASQESEEESDEVESLPLKVARTSSVETQTLPDMRNEGAEAEIQPDLESRIEAVEPPSAEALPTDKQVWTDSQTKELEALKRESQEAQRIRMLHESSKAMDMENQIESLRRKLVEKQAETVKLRKELDSFKTNATEAGIRHVYQLSGQEQLGTTLSIDPVDEKSSALSVCTIQWYRVARDGSKDAIFGAIRPQYAPEPHDVGKFLRAEVQVPGRNAECLQTSGCIDPSPGLEKYVENLISRGAAQFNVRIVLKNGEVVSKQSLHTLDVNKTRMKLYGRSVKANEVYSTSMQLCGARGGGDSAAQGLFWVVKRSLTFMLVLESERERNAVILLARKFAELNDILLSGPADDLRSK